jgi:hypothetical protein
MTQSDFDKWKELRAAQLFGGGAVQLGWKQGADAAYNLLSKEISEKDGEIKYLEHECNRLVQEVNSLSAALDNISERGNE